MAVCNSNWRAVPPPNTRFLTALLRAQVPLLLCAVVVGNSYPVSESPQDADGGFNGKPIRAKADSHITVVAKASADALPLPLPPDKWGAARVSTELVVRDESQVLRSPPTDGVPQWHAHALSPHLRHRVLSVAPQRPTKDDLRSASP